MRPVLRPWSLAALGLAALADAGCRPPPPLDGRSAYAADEPLAEAWLRSALSVPQDRFMRIEGIGKLPTRVRGDSAYWAERFLPPTLRPHAQPAPGLIVSIHPRDDRSYDLVRYEYTVGALRLTVTDSASFTLIRVSGGASPAAETDDTAQRLAALAGEILAPRNDGHPYQFVPVAAKDATPRFSTSPELDVARMSAWDERTDAGVLAGAPYFFLYKKYPQRIGYDNASNWFEEDFRKIFRLF